MAASDIHTNFVWQKILRCHCDGFPVDMQYLGANRFALISRGGNK